MQIKIHIIGACLLLLTLAACGSKVNQTNFDKIKGNMAEQEVIAILGEPTESSDEVSRGAIGKWQKLIWKNDKTGDFIDIQFSGGKVQILFGYEEDGQEGHEEDRQEGHKKSGGAARRRPDGAARRDPGRREGLGPPHGTEDSPHRLPDRDHRALGFAMARRQARRATSC